VGEAQLTGKAGAKGFTVSIPVTNTGSCSGTETLQVYIRDLADSEGPLKSLRGFQRIAVKAGETAVANIALDRERFEFWDPSTNTMRVKPGTYELLYGTSSADRDLTKLQVTIE
jgi:beta-glucosidase